MTNKWATWPTIALLQVSKSCSSNDDAETLPTITLAADLPSLAAGQSLEFKVPLALSSAPTSNVSLDVRLQDQAGHFKVCCCSARKYSYLKFSFPLVHAALFRS